MNTSIERLNEAPYLSVIVPFRDEGVVSWFLPRLEELCKLFPKNPDIEFIVVDSGSVSRARQSCEDMCIREGIRYIWHDSVGQVFSIGEVRDYGVVHARGRAVTFFDIDWRFPTDFWNRLLMFMKTYGISKYKKRFFTIPALYLTEEGSEEFIETPGDNRFSDFYLRWLNGNSPSIQNMSPSSSIIVTDRMHYLSVGGHHPAFRGHGFEDFELCHRLVEEEARLPPPDLPLKETKTWETATYNGFRSRFALLGRPAMLNNLFVVHLWHPRPKSLSFYNSKKMKQVREIWPDLFKEFLKSGNHPTPLIPAANQSRRVLIIGKQNTNITRCLRDVIPYLGEPIYAHEDDLFGLDEEIDLSDVELLIRNSDVELVLFNSPYGNARRKLLYDWCRHVNFPYLVFERGALEESWFFDPNGFNADSSSYKPEYWDKPLDRQATEHVENYIKSAILSDGALEKQGNRVGGCALADKLCVGGQKVLFVPLQRPSDVVTVHMAGIAESCEKFLAAIDDAARLLKRQGWVVICKKHPLEVDSLELKHAIYAPDDTHFLDLLELSSAVALINSGVGLYAMMMGKPCYVFGKAFYDITGVNKSMLNLAPESIRDAVLLGYVVDRDKVLRFMRFLLEDFYSFGSATTEVRSEQDHSLRSLTRKIDFYQIKLPGILTFSYEPEVWEKVSKSAPLFERYKLDLVQKSNLQKNSGVKYASSTKATPMIRTTVTKKSSSSSNSEELFRKLRKFKRNPYAFFDDSKYKLLCRIKYVFYWWQPKTRQL